jgi:(E)-2-((N-methylformamido)methylene)succinate hydrolase
VIRPNGPSGQPVTPTLVLIHGVGLDHTMWDPLRASLPADRPVITYDLLGHGDAPLLPDGSDIHALVDQLATVVDGPVDLVGFSLGALIAQEFTLRFPERVRRLILVNGVFDRTPNERAAILTRVADVRDGGYLANVAQAIDRWFSPEFSAAHPHMQAAVTQRMTSNDVQSYANAYEIFGLADRDLATRIHAIRCPTLVITGEHDGRSTPAMTHALAAAVANGRARIIPRSRHLTPLETPAALAHLIETFLGEPDA